MPPKVKLPAPIDRPLSRAYLREFTGWSTAFAPGLSEPTSLRVLENMTVNRDGSLRVRPGMRYLSYASPGTGITETCVGTHEAFFLNDGTKAYLFAVRESDDTVGFRVLSFSDTINIVRHLTDAGIDFTVPQTEAVLNFSAATTYVKYLQIDNKIFALSNAGETMRVFSVGSTKSARKLTTVERPTWELTDKLTVVKPDQPWISAGIPTAVRTNLLPNTGFETNLTGVDSSAATDHIQSTTLVKSGTKALRINSLPSRTNLVPQPLHDVATTGVTGWTPGSGAATVAASGTAMRCTAAAGATSRSFYANGPTMTGIDDGTSYVVAFDLVSTAGVSSMHTMLRFYGANGAQVGADQQITHSIVAGRIVVGNFTAPSGAVTARMYLRGVASSTATARFDVKNVVFVKFGESAAMFTGASGANYFWVGATNASASVYHPPVDTYVWTGQAAVVAGKTYTGSWYVRAGAAARSVYLRLDWRNSSDTIIATTTSATTADATGSWTRYVATAAAPAGAVKVTVVAFVLAVPRGEYHYLDEAMVEEAGSAGAYFDGSTTSTSTVKNTWTGTAYGSPSKSTTYAVASTIPAAETPTANTLTSSTPASNVYNFAYFYTISNEIGESAPSQVTLTRTQRRQSAWRWEAGNAAGEPNGTEVTDPALATDQLVAIMPQDAYDDAKAQGAIAWNLYMLSWSDQDAVPPEGLLVESKPITTAGAYGTEGWIRHTVQNIDASSSQPLPTAGNRLNFSSPSAGGNGLVAADRMIMVYDPTAPAVVRWSSNRVGEYSNFSASKNGGYKTLTSGNLFVPACVKLWQNTQSVDTLTILCLGVDGYSAAYYMAPAQVTSQTDATQLMGFEETTSTPGTCSPYGVEVMNNALYHPTESELIKSSIAMYNVNHKTMTDLIANMWVAIQDKDKIVSSQLDNRIYYLVHNAYGEPLEPGCWGNEIWIYDAAAATGNWSRWMVQACSLRKIEIGDKLVMSVIRPSGIYYFDNQVGTDASSLDQYVDPTSHAVLERAISWRCETNTQGANRAHDAWAHLQQANIVLGNFTGTMRYGVRGQDRHGKWHDVNKLVTDGKGVPADGLPFDLEDFLLIRRDLKEWRFYAQSETVDGTVQPCAGQINLVQYRYTPVSVNVGYEYGSVETFEYGRNAEHGADSYSANGVPVPLVDLSRP